MMSGILNAQSLRDSVITGKVSYKSAENIYVKFDDTQDIEKDDTLFVKSKGKFVPVIIIKYDWAF